MVPEANPVPTKGERNIYCPFYNNCLDYAVRYSWETWNCSQCPYRMMKQPIKRCEYEVKEADSDYVLRCDFPWDIGYDLSE
jgi:hypothetical protein